MQDETYKILNVLEFNSTRKRMSVIVEDERGTLKLYCKGADSVIFERLAPNQPFKDTTTAHLKSFACDGLRMLCLGVAQLSREKYNDWAAVRSASCFAHPHLLFCPLSFCVLLFA